MMTQNQDFFRQRRICYWDTDPKRFNSQKGYLLNNLKFLPDITLERLNSLDDDKFFPCDVLIINATSIPEKELFPWIQRIKDRIRQQGRVWTPALILSNANFAQLSSWLHEYAASNWYFDIVHSDQMSSIPIRIANLLRIHDHLHELYRYQEQLDTMQAHVYEIELKIKQLTLK